MLQDPPGPSDRAAIRTPRPWPASWRSAPSPFIAIWNSCATGWSCRSDTTRNAVWVSSTPSRSRPSRPCRSPEGELFALVVAEKALQQYRGTSFEKPAAQRLAERWSSRCPTPFRSACPISSKPSRFARRAEPILNLEIFDTLAKATTARRQLRTDLSQTGPAAARATHRRSLSPGQHQRRMVPLRLRSSAQRPPHVCPRAHQSHSAHRQDLRAPRKVLARERLRGSFGVQSGQGRVRRGAPLQRASGGLHPRKEMARVAATARTQGTAGSNCA